MGTEHLTRRARRWRSAWLQFAIAALGLVAIVGSGGGGGLDAVCDVYPDSCGPPPPPPPTLGIDPPSVTAQVGSAVSFKAVVANGSGSYSWQWRRSEDGGATFVNIPGANASSYSLASVNLADDGAQFMALAWQGVSAALPATAHLAVSATPGIVFSDGQFLTSQWRAAPAIVAGYPTFAHSEEQVPADGHPDAFRRMNVEVAPGSGVSNVSHLRLASTYDPAVQGAIRVIDYAEDCIQLDASAFTYVESGAFIEQLGRRYFSSRSPVQCSKAGWTRVTLDRLSDRDFEHFDGPACGAGETCPDFSASGAPMRFGYVKSTFGAPGDSAQHGIDNWKITVWRR